MNTTDYIMQVIDPVLYSDAFDCALTFDEIRDYGLARIQDHPLQQLLDRLVAQGVVCRTSGFYHLPGREALADHRPELLKRARRLQLRAVKVAGWLRFVPFIRGIYLTGSVAADSAEPGADLDLMMVVARDRLGTVFMFLGPLSRLLSREIFCPNYYICETELSLDRKSHYVAREVVQARPLLGRGNPLLDANQWVREWFPNFRGFRSTANFESGSFLQRVMEWPLRGRLGSFVENKAHQLAQRRLDIHHEERGFPVPDRVQEQFVHGLALRFHASQKVQSAVTGYREVTARVRTELNELSDSLHLQRDDHD